MHTFIYQFVVLSKINRLTLKRFEQKYLVLSGFTFKDMRISPANTLCMNVTLYGWTFNFRKVVWQQNSGSVEDFILPYSAVYLRIQKWKNYWNRSTFAKVIVKIKVAPFLWPTVYNDVIITAYRDAFNWQIWRQLHSLAGISLNHEGTQTYIG